MTSLRDKLKSKKNKNEQPETMDSFDENSLSVTYSQGDSQLNLIKIHCIWNSNKNNIKPPKLNCKWYNRTENNIVEIQGIDGEIYQPSIADVDSIIQISCVPQIPGISYEGMPILLKTGQIKLSPQTEADATSFLKDQQAKFLIDFREGKIGFNYLQPIHKGAIRIEKDKLIIEGFNMNDKSEVRLIELKIDQNYPQCLINRKISQQLTIRLPDGQWCTVFFKDNSVRDVFCLLTKLTLAENSLNKETIAQDAHKMESTDVRMEEKSDKWQQVELRNRKSQGEYKNEFEQSRAQLRMQSCKQLKLKSSSSEVLSILNLKQQIKRHEVQNKKLLKQYEQKQQQCTTLRQKEKILEERLQNITKNYFKLEDTISKLNQEIQELNNVVRKKEEEKLYIQENIIYYKNQIKIIEDKYNQLELKYQQVTANQESSLQSNLVNYQQLLNQFNCVKNENEELKNKVAYFMEEKDIMETELKNSRSVIESIQSQKNNIAKKYQSLTKEINLSPTSIRSKMSESNSPIRDSPENTESILNVISCDSDYKEKQILSLQKQLSELVEENNSLRQIVKKQKKQSRSHLKLQLMQIKKLVKKLSQTIMQKSQQILHLKQLNRSLIPPHLLKQK